MTEKLTESAEFQNLSERYNTTVENQQLLLERLAELELALEDQSWTRMIADSDREFSPGGRTTIRRMARLSYIKSPLINHAVRIQSNYVWAQGMNTQADNPDVSDLLQDFLDDKHNRRVLTGSTATRQTEIELQCEGDSFISMKANKSTGKVRVKKFIPDEITDVFTNPEDEDEVWFYKREFRVRSDSVHTSYDRKVIWYPDWRYQYNTDHEMPNAIDGNPIDWERVVRHVKVGGFSDAKFGIPEIYNALDWAIAVKSNLEDFASITRALTRFAWRAKTKGGPKGVAAVKSKLSTTLGNSGSETNPAPVAGSTLISTDAVDMDPIKTAGVAPSPDESQRLWLMVSAGTGIPLTMLSGDAEAGSYATAQTLDRPTELQMKARQALWADVYRDIFDYVIDCAIAAPNGPLKGGEEIDDMTGEVTFALNGDGDRSFDIEFPEILARDMQSTVAAVVSAATLDGNAIAGTLDRKTTVKLLLSALGMDDTDEILEEILSVDPEIPDEITALNPIDPTLPPVPTLPAPTPLAQKTPNAITNQPTTEALRESAAIQQFAEPTGKAIAAGAKNLRDGKISKEQFVSGGRTVLHAAYVRAAHAGMQQAGFTSPNPPNPLVQAMAGRAQDQANFLGDWADGLMGAKVMEAAATKPVPPPVDTSDDEMSDDGIDSRAAQYGRTVRAAFFAGLVGAATGALTGAKKTDATQPEPEFEWDGGDCPLCAERDGQTYTESELPCLPGEGGYGEFCEGGGNCNCNLTLVHPVQESGRIRRAWKKIKGDA